jgi:hypothetical protein
VSSADLTFRPRVGKVILLSVLMLALGLFGLIANSPTYIKGLAAAALLLGVLGPLHLRTAIVLSPTGVRVRTALWGTYVFRRGDASVRVTQAPTGFFGSAPVITIRQDSDGRQIGVILVGFQRNVRDTLPSLVRRHLAPL